MCIGAIVRGWGTDAVYGIYFRVSSPHRLWELVGLRTAPEGHCVDYLGLLVFIHSTLFVCVCRFLFVWAVASRSSAISAQRAFLLCSQICRQRRELIPPTLPTTLATLSVRITVVGHVLPSFFVSHTQKLHT